MTDFVYGELIDMPEFSCSECGAIFEVTFEEDSDDAVEYCPSCGEKLDNTDTTYYEETEIVGC